MNTILTTHIDYARGNIIDNLPCFCEETLEYDESNILGTKTTELIKDLSNSCGLNFTQAKNLIVNMIKDEAMRFVIEDSEPSDQGTTYL